jgi:ribosomal protein S18 acetylase RimI-like enzyme
MVCIRFASEKDISLISKLAHAIWPKAYQNILSSEQIDFMLNDMYSHEDLLAQFNNTVQFLIVEIAGDPAGFASFSLLEGQGHIFKIHKLYLLADFKGKGIGNQLIRFIEDNVKLKGGKSLEVNVNRNNPAVAFYLKSGFEIIKEVDIPYHQFVLNDYVMRKTL